MVGTSVEVAEMVLGIVVVACIVVADVVLTAVVAKVVVETTVNKVDGATDVADRGVVVVVMEILLVLGAGLWPFCW